MWCRFKNTLWMILVGQRWPEFSLTSLSRMWRFTKALTSDQLRKWFSNCIDWRNRQNSPSARPNKCTFAYKATLYPNLTVFHFNADSTNKSYHKGYYPCLTLSKPFWVNTPSLAFLMKKQTQNPNTTFRPWSSTVSVAICQHSRNGWIIWSETGLKGKISKMLKLSVQTGTGFLREIFYGGKVGLLCCRRPLKGLLWEEIRNMRRLLRKRASNCLLG